MAKDTDVKRLVESICSSRKALEWYRKQRREDVLLYAGSGYSQETSEISRPINLIDLYVRINSRALIAKNPRVMISTRLVGEKPAVRGMQDWTNRQIVKMDLASTLRACVIDGFFRVGIAYCGLATPADAALSAWGMKAGDPYVCPVSLDDYVCDMNATRPGSFTYEGHLIRVPLDAVKDSKFYSSARRKLEPQERRQTTDTGNDRTDTLSDWAVNGNRAEFVPMVNLWVVYLPQERKLLTLAADETGEPNADDDPLRETTYIGHPAGPYRRLGFGYPPDCPMPKGVIPDLVDLDLDANDSWRKLSRQAERLKKIGMVRSTNTEDGQAIRNAKDGEIIAVGDPSSFAEAQTGGPSAELLGFFETARGLFSWFAENLDAAGGLQPQAKTATQEKLLAAGAGAGVAGKQDTVVEFTSQVCESLAWYYWHHPFSVMETEVSPPGVPEVSLPRRVYPRDAVEPLTGAPRPLRRQAPWEELDVKVDPYSLAAQTPAQRSEGLKAIFMDLIAPVMGLLQQQGINVDMNVLLQRIGEYDDLPDLAEILRLQEPPQEPVQARGGAGQEGGGMPAQTSREYIRRNVPQDTEGQRRQEVMEMMASGGSRNGEGGGGGY